MPLKMIIEEKTTVVQSADVPVADLVLPFDLRQKSRLRAMLSNGEEASLFMPRGTILRDGDWLKAKDGRIVRVVAAPERVMQVTCMDAQSLARVAYHLGNRHVPLQVGDGWLRLEHDHVLKKMAQGLGATVDEAIAAFEPEAGAYGADKHAHGSGNAKIHDHYHEPTHPPHTHHHGHSHEHGHEQ